MKLKNVVAVLAAPDDPLLADASVNRFFYLRHLAPYWQPNAIPGAHEKMLRPGGQVIM
jgi:hypothetical protein